MNETTKMRLYDADNKAVYLEITGDHEMLLKTIYQVMDLNTLDLPDVKPVEDIQACLRDGGFGVKEIAPVDDEHLDLEFDLPGNECELFRERREAQQKGDLV